MKHYVVTKLEQVKPIQRLRLAADMRVNIQTPSTSKLLKRVNKCKISIKTDLLSTKLLK